MITILDSIMGSGKTTYIHDHINTRYRERLLEAFGQEDHNQVPHQPPRFMFITPLLDEVERLQAACPLLDFKDPQPIEGRKLRHLETLVRNGENIASTHALFRLLNRRILEELKAKNYVLVIDEVLDCVEIFDGLSKPDKDLLFRDRMIYVDEQTRRLRWNTRNHQDYKGRFDPIRDLCENGNLVARSGQIIMWEFPQEFLECFQEVFVLTYLFEGSPMASYLKAAGLSYQTMAVQEGKLVPREDVDETAIKAELQGLIEVYEGPMNAIGDKTGRENPLSSSWCKRQDKSTWSRLRNSTRRFFEVHAGTPTHENMWCCLKETRQALKGPGYSKGFVPLGTKATNDYAHKAAAAYLANVFPNTVIKGHFKDLGIEMDSDLYALSEMIQWIWRSRIRNGEPIKLFIPSERMRGLFRDWLFGQGRWAVSPVVALAA